MKKVFLIVAFLATTILQRSFAQDTTAQTPLPGLLSCYYGIKDALVAGNAGIASQKAEGFIKTLNSIDYKIISEGNVDALLKDATPISESKDINRQRGYFANLSNNMAVLAKSLRLSAEPIYQAYCPMKKASWLSPDPAIRNPYYGSAMLTCGKLVDTINPQ